MQTSSGVAFQFQNRFCEAVSCPVRRGPETWLHTAFMVAERDAYAEQLLQTLMSVCLSLRKVQREIARIRHFSSPVADTSLSLSLRLRMRVFALVVDDWTLSFHFLTPS